MLLDQGPSWRQRSQPQPVNQAQDLSEQGSWYGDLRHLERDIATVAKRALTGAKLEEVEHKIAQLERIRASLKRVIAACPGSGALEACPDYG